MYDVWISRQAHTITVLVVFSCILVYVTLFEEETYGADYNNKRYILWFLWFTRKNWGEVQVEYNIWFLICIEVESRFQIQGQGHTKINKSRTKWSKVMWIYINWYMVCSMWPWTNFWVQEQGHSESCPVHNCSLLESVWLILGDF